MPTITLPNGDRRPFDRPVSGAELAASIGPGLAKLAKLNAEGPTPEAFTFKARFPQPDKIGGPEDMQPEPYCVGWE